MTDQQQTDLLQQGVVLVLLICAAICLGLAAADAEPASRLPGLKHLGEAVGFGLIAAHIIRVGKMY